MDYICRMQPRGFVLENVTGIRNKKRRKHFNKLLQQLKECRLPGSQKRAYAVSWRMVNSRSFGLPQNRKRIYIMGARRSTRKGVKTRKPNMVHSLPESKFACLDDFLEKGLPKVDIKKLCKTKRNNILAGRKKLKAKGVWNLDRDIIDAGAGKKLPAGHLGLCSHNHMCTSLRRQLLARQRFLSKPDLASANNQVWRVAQPAARLQPVLRKVAFSASRSWRLCRDSTTSAGPKVCPAPREAKWWATPCRFLS